MRIDLKVTVDGMFHRYGAGCEVPELQRECFEPLKTTDDRMIAFATGETIANSTEARKVLKTREDAAKILAEALTEIIIDAMKANDTHNGYAKET